MYVMSKRIVDGCRNIDSHVYVYVTQRPSVLQGFTRAFSEGFSQEVQLLA